MGSILVFHHLLLQLCSFVLSHKTLKCHMDQSGASIMFKLGLVKHKTMIKFSYVWTRFFDAYLRIKIGLWSCQALLYPTDANEVSVAPGTETTINILPRQNRREDFAAHLNVQQDVTLGKQAAWIIKTEVSMYSDGSTVFWHNVYRVRQEVRNSWRRWFQEVKEDETKGKKYNLKKKALNKEMRQNRWWPKMVRD